ncbi:DUF4959 domain-containing protein [uncultured Butyricimonas sp.]|uniref:DUF4959 domain-containing protein n=1 Tax=uncultured Butyricimonas sp. TaxID=1268785 RepID=UPI0026DC97F7|nr:DUF4959 domain-containing protein [uncultured Butyricimonas sp.]
MRNILFVLLFFVFSGCQDDGDTFGLMMPKDGLSFRPIAGGAVMYYNLPEDDETLFIRVRYRDAYGQEMLRTGSYACDSLLLVGFNEARQNIPATVTLCNRARVESEPIEVTFDTKDSGPVAFFENVKVASNWNGFTVSYDVTGYANGMAHVLYTGKNPLTQEPDTLLISSFPIMEGTDTLSFQVQQESESNTVVIRTEDFRGYMVKQKIWENVEAYSTEKLARSQFEFLDPNKFSKNDPEAQLGFEYLFDGDIKGETCCYLADNVWKTYLAGPGVFGEDLFIIDFKEPKQIAQLRIYCMLNMRDFPYNSIWRTVYDNKLPCKLSVYVSNNKDDKDSWKKMASFEQDREMDASLRWCVNAATSNWDTMDESEVRAAKPSYMEVMLPASGETYQYLKVVVDDTFENEIYGGSGNDTEYVTMHELEIFTKKD